MARLNPRALEIAHANRSEAGEKSTGNKRDRTAQIARIRPWQWKPGQSGNPAGRRRQDVSSEIARATFERNTEAIYRALAGRLLKGDPYAFKELAERGYGKLNQPVEFGVNDELLARLTAGRKRAASQ